MYSGQVKFVSDSDIAHILGMSKSWVRKERFNRRHGHPHILDIDPIYFGSSPRYSEADVIRWCRDRQDIGACRPEILEEMRPAGPAEFSGQEG